MVGKRTLYRYLKYPPQIAYKLGLGPLLGRVVLLLTTTGRKSGLSRVTPLQYEIIDDVIHIGSMTGDRADWVKNILADSHVKIRIKNLSFSGTATVHTDNEKIADFIEYRYQRRPYMIGAILRADGLTVPPTRNALLAYAHSLALVTIHPDVTE